MAVIEYANQPQEFLVPNGDEIQSVSVVEGKIVEGFYFSDQDTKFGLFTNAPGSNPPVPVQVAFVDEDNPDFNTVIMAGTPVQFFYVVTSPDSYIRIANDSGGLAKINLYMRIRDNL